MTAAFSKRLLLFSSSALVCLGLYLSSLYSYLFFHSVAEIFSVAVAFGIFSVTWNSRRFMENNYLSALGVAYLFVGCLDLLHTLAYKGMGVFVGRGANLATQLWIAARYLESISLLIAPWFLQRKIKMAQLLTCYLAVFVVILLSIFYWNIFPACYHEATGLTAFKILSEYVICLMLLLSIISISRRRREFDSDVFKLIIASIVSTIGAELAFTFYLNVYGLSNLIGHFFKIISFFLIYRAVIVTGLNRPYSIMFRNLKKSEEILRAEKARLEEALSDIKTLRGLLPICANCKKIRDDKGYWNQLETYIHDHSEAKVSHGICPECREKLYPGI
ncbi:MAG: hypothetical protein JSW26_27755 [Desulfobacterales bacterium]|nr:MAG: hypothetical protein JSW26_27755 [Desulfobacterales bacterium]